MRRGGALSIPSLHGCGKVTQIVPEKRSLQGFCPRTGFKNLLRLESSSDSWSSLISQGCVKQKEEHKIQSCCLHMEVVENRSGLRVLPGMSTPGPEWCVVSFVSHGTYFLLLCKLLLFPNSRARVPRKIKPSTGSCSLGCRLYVLCSILTASSVSWGKVI